MSSSPLATSGHGAPINGGVVPPEVNMVEATSNPTQPPQTFREKLLADQQRASAETRQEFEPSDSDLKAFHTPEGPVVQISERYREILHKQWSNTVIVKMWDRTIGYKTLCNRLPNLWGIRSELKVIDLNNNFYFVRLLNQYDYLKVITGGPWVILGHYLTVEPWKPQFTPSTHKITSVVIWIQLPELSCEYYDMPILRAVCNLIGRFVRIDYNTQESNRGKFARVAVELDLSKPLQPRVFVDGKWSQFNKLPHQAGSCEQRLGHHIDHSIPSPASPSS
ncbi:hypothetical protein Tsubulata_029372 [Turnera subulata]|uniref:DUF4283 domain-containing protein n=1 Tax=Turnera subulata TaxID=218843 RepID=A0A9Q0IZS7_9ROSI|nr:hypothetical protein Tsubulata_029372 [Turnera subulata]